MRLKTQQEKSALAILRHRRFEVIQVTIEPKAKFTRSTYPRTANM